MFTSFIKVLVDFQADCLTFPQGENKRNRWKWSHVRDIFILDVESPSASERNKTWLKLKEFLTSWLEHSSENTIKSRSAPRISAWCSKDSQDSAIHLSSPFSASLHGPAASDKHAGLKSHHIFSWLHVNADSLSRSSLSFRILMSVM